MGFSEVAVPSGACVASQYDCVKLVRLFAAIAEAYLIGAALLFLVVLLETDGVGRLFDRLALALVLDLSGLRGDC